MMGTGFRVAVSFHGIILSEYFTSDMEIEEEKGSRPETNVSRDELRGRLVVVVLVFGTMLMLGFIVFLGYRAYENRSGSKASIADIRMTVSKEPEAKPEEILPEIKENIEESTPVVDQKEVKIMVLNGGGAKGAAGALADSLNKAGYVGVTAGNADGNYSGVTVFYQEGKESAAKTVLSNVAKSYPGAAVVPSDPKRKETGINMVVVVLGK